jgi:trehalose-6-phosphate synthase
VLTGLLGADLVGFHTAAYMRHFVSSVLRTLGVASDVDRLRWDGRNVRIGVFPMGVDASGFADRAASSAVAGQLATVRSREPEGTRLLVGIDRLDYTKGIPRRLLSYEHMLRKYPELREKVRLIQVAVPSRTNVERYQDFRSMVDTLIGRIHGQFATPSWVPVHYIYRGLPVDEVVALYRAADAMLVTPLRDGMNLVAKEFVASRTDEDGVLVLSDFAGACQRTGGGGAREPLRRRRNGRGLLPGADHARGGTALAHARPAPPGVLVRHRTLGTGLPGSPDRDPGGGAGTDGDPRSLWRRRARRRSWCCCWTTTVR